MNNIEKVLFESACEFLYYGYGFKSFLIHCESAKNNPDLAKKIWKKAFEKMGNDY